MEPSRSHGIAARAAATLRRNSTGSAAVVALAAWLVCQTTALGQVNRPPSPLPAPGPHKPPTLRPPNPPKPEDPGDLLAKDPPVPAGDMIERDSLPLLAWIEPIDGAGGGNATVLLDKATSAISVITTIDALGFPTGARKVRIRMTEGWNADAAAPCGRWDCLEASAYDFRAPPTGDPLSGLCVLRLGKEEASFIPDEGALVFRYTDSMRTHRPPDGGKLTAIALTRRQDGALERGRIDVQGNEQARTLPPGTPAFAAVGAAGGARELPLLVGIATEGGVRPWPDLRRLTDGWDRLQPIDDRRALDNYLRAEGAWGNPDGVASAIGWARDNSFPRLVHWQVWPAPADQLEFAWTPRSIDGADDGPRMLSAVSGLKGDDLAMELRNGSSAGADRHHALDAAVAVRSARDAATARLTARIGWTDPAPGGEAPRRILILESSAEAKQAPESPKDASPAR